MTYSRTTKLVHILIAAGILIELLNSLVMRYPRPGRVRAALEIAAYQAHEMVGLVLLALLALHWLLWLRRRDDRGLAHFFPWLSRSRMASLRGELQMLAALRLPDPDAQNCLAGAIQGIGILLASLLAIAGLVLYFGIDAVVRPSGSIRAIKGFHEALGPAMWAYLGVHAGAVLAHIALGHRAILEIFRFSTTR